MDGILYTFTFYNAGDSISEDEITSLIDSLTFDSSLLEKRTIECGDYTMTVPGVYQPVKFDGDSDSHDETCVAKFGKDRVDFSVLYFKADDYTSPEEMANIMKENMTDTDYSEISEDCGKCYYVTGLYNGNHEVISFFEKKDKLYMLDLFSETADFSIEDMQSITKTIKKKE